MRTIRIGPSERRLDPGVDRSPFVYLARIMAKRGARLTSKRTVRLDEDAEVADAGTAGKRSLVISVSADFMIHLLFLLALCDADFQDVLVELERSFDVSGIDEKESRQK